MSYLEKTLDIYSMMNEGKLLEAFDKYYHNDVVMQEAGQEPRVGKVVNRAYEENFVGMVQEIHGGGINAITSDEEKGIVMIENWMDMTFKDGNRVKMEQVNVQKWEGDQIVHEKFYHV